MLSFNMSELVNGYRPHQARETLCRMMEERLEGMREEVRKVGEGRERAVRLLEGMKEVGRDGSGKDIEDGGRRGGGEVKSGKDRVEAKRKASQRGAWAALEELG